MRSTQISTNIFWIIIIFVKPAITLSYREWNGTKNNSCYYLLLSLVDNLNFIILVILKYELFKIVNGPAMRIVLKNNNIIFHTQFHTMVF